MDLLYTPGKKGRYRDDFYYPYNEGRIVWVFRNYVQVMNILIFTHAYNRGISMILR